jgi:beta-lactamase superfamily II metal-dependent hydrolase
MIVHSLPARFGDSLLVTWGSPPRAMLIDAGLGGTYAESIRPALARCRAQGIGQLELVVVTHLDRDHIGGIEDTLQRQHEHGLRVAEVWFNGEPQLPRTPLRPRSVAQGEALGRQLLEQAIPWNARFGGKAVSIPARGPLPCVRLPGGMRVTILAPDFSQLRRLAAIWPEAVAGEEGSAPAAIRGARAVRRPPVSLPIDIDGLAARPFNEDDSVPNGSSIAVLVEQGRRAAVLTGDAYPSAVLAGWKRLVASRGKAPAVHLLKLSHHGSSTNTSPELLRALRPRRVLVSSDGSAYGHPHAETLAWAIRELPGLEVAFNYDNAYSRPWATAAAQPRAMFKVRVGNADGIEMAL